MRLTLRELKLTIREATEGAFISKLKRLTENGKLPLTHETSFQTLADIWKSGGIDGGGSVFFSLGHLREKNFYTGHGAIIHVDVPMGGIVSYYDFVPDMVYETEDEFMEQFPGDSIVSKDGKTHAEVSLGIDLVPLKWFVNVLNNETLKPIHGR